MRNLDPQELLPDLPNVSRETLDRLGRYVALLREWSDKINLVAAGDLQTLWQRHIADSLQLTSLVQESAGSAIDLGSGAGFPGIPLALATGLHFDLVESDHRKSAFLREAIRVTGAPAAIHIARAETVQLAHTRLITARAFAPLTRLLPLAARLLASDGVCLLPKGAGVDHELTEAAKQWHMRVERFPSSTDTSGVILRISQLARV
jgi:16S rRNA (guanine527-N7)-methyltransferase